MMIDGVPAYEDKMTLYTELIINEKSMTQLGKEMGCSMEVIRKNFHEHGLYKSKPWKEVYEESKDEILFMHEAGLNTPKGLGYWIGCHPSAMKMIMKEMGLYETVEEEVIVEDVEVEVSRYRKFDVNHNFFKTWNSDMAYVVGFINADGTLYTPKGRKYPMLTISQKRESREILEKIKDVIGHEGSIKDYMAKAQSGIYPYSEMTVYSSEIAKDLNRLGIVENKSLIKEIPNGLPEEFEIDYIRGYFDGNGSVGKQYPTNSKGFRSETCQIRIRIFSGSEKHLEQMQKTLQKYGFKKKKVNKNNKKGTLFEICYSTKESLMLYDIFYSDSSSMRMKRKYEAFTEYKLQREADQKKKESN